MARLPKTKSKANESRICSHFAKAAQCPVEDNWKDQVRAFNNCQPGDRFPWLAADVRLFHLEADVMSLVMRGDTLKMDQDLLMELVGDPDQVFLVQDEGTVGVGSLWFVVLEDYEAADEPSAGHLVGWPVRMFVNSFVYAGQKLRVTVVQMPTAFIQS